MVKTILSVLLIALFITSTAIANEGRQHKHGTPQNLDQVKTRLINRIDNKITRLQQKKQCIEKAASMEDLKKCRHAGMEDNQSDQE